MQRRAKIQINTCLKKRKDVSADLKSRMLKKDNKERKIEERFRSGIGSNQ